MLDPVLLAHIRRSILVKADVNATLLCLVRRNSSDQLIRFHCKEAIMFKLSGLFGAALITSLLKQIGFGSMKWGLLRLCYLSALIGIVCNEQVRKHL